MIKEHFGTFDVFLIYDHKIKKFLYFFLNFMSSRTRSFFLKGESMIFLFG